MGPRHSPQSQSPWRGIRIHIVCRICRACSHDVVVVVVAVADVIVIAIVVVIASLLVLLLLSLFPLLLLLLLLFWQYFLIACYRTQRVVTIVGCTVRRQAVRRGVGGAWQTRQLPNCQLVLETLKNVVRLWLWFPFAL